MASRPGMSHGHIFKKMYSRYLWEVSKYLESLGKEGEALRALGKTEGQLYLPSASHNTQEFSLKELKRSSLEGTANQPPNSKFKTVLTLYIFFLPAFVCSVQRLQGNWISGRQTHTSGLG